MLKRSLPKNILLAHVALIIATLIWAAAGPVIKITLGYISPVSFLFLRFLVVCVLLLPFMVWQFTQIRINVKDLFNFFLLGVFSQTSLLLVFYSLNYTSVLDYTIITVTGAILSVYAGHYFFKEKIDIKLKVGLVVASIGTLLIILEPFLTGIKNHAPMSERILGNLICVAYQFIWVIYIMWSKMIMGEESPNLKRTLRFVHLRPMTKKYSSTIIATTSFYVGLVTLIPLVIFEGVRSAPFDVFSIDTIGLIGILYMAVASSIIAYLLYQWSLEYTKVSDTVIYGYLNPIFTLPFAYFLVGEVPNKFMLIGGFIIACGVVIAEMRKS